MIIKMNGVVLKQVNYGESSVIVKVFTEDAGLRSFMVNSVRKKGARVKQNMLHQLANVEIIAYQGAHSEILKVKEIRPLAHYHEVLHDVRKSSLLMFLDEIVYRALREEVANGEMYHFLKDSVMLLEKMQSGLACFHLFFMIELTRHLGFHPRNNFSENENLFNMRDGFFVAGSDDDRPILDDALSRILSECLSKSGLEAMISEVKITRTQQKDLLDAMVAYYQYHVTGFSKVNSLQVLNEVFR